MKITESNVFLKLPEVVAHYEQILSQLPDKLSISGKTLEFCLKEQAVEYSLYTQCLSEIKRISNMIDIKLDEKVGDRLRYYVEVYNHKLTDRTIRSYIDAETAIINIRVLKLEVGELLDKFTSAVDAFEKRGYALKSLTDAYVHQVYQSSL